jgi:hypothetical protein
MSNHPVELRATIDVKVWQDDNYAHVIVSGPEWSATGNARREPGDEPNDEIGFMLAFGRALENAGRKLQKRGNGLVKHADDVKAAKMSADDEIPELEDLVRWLRDVGAVDEPHDYLISHGFSPGPDFSNPNDPVFNLLGVDPTDDGETIFVRFHFAGADG